MRNFTCDDTYRLYQCYTNEIKCDGLPIFTRFRMNSANPEILSWKLCSSHRDLLGHELDEIIIPKHVI